MADTFNAVFYSEPVPSSLETLTLLALVFDRVYFPGVFIPECGVDEAETKKEIQRIGDSITDIERSQMLNCMRYALWAKNLKGFCIFTGNRQSGILEEGANELTHEIEKAIFGPPPPNSPIIRLGGWFERDLPGDDGIQVNAPNWTTYPANALIFAARNNLPLINDNPNLPVPGIGNASIRSNAQSLSTILAIESIKVVLPKLKALTPPELEDFREETKEIVKPFRMAMLRLSRDLNGAIEADSSLEDVQREAKFIVETCVLPELTDLRRFIEDPSGPWYRRVVGLFKFAPELLGNYATLSPTLASARVFAKLAEVLANTRDEQLSKEKAIKRSGLYYLLKVESRASSD